MAARGVPAENSIPAPAFDTARRSWSAPSEAVAPVPWRVDILSMTACCWAVVVDLTLKATRASALARTWPASRYSL